MPTPTHAGRTVFETERQRTEKDYARGLIGPEEYSRRITALADRLRLIEQPIGPESPTLPAGLTDPRELGLGTRLEEMERLGPNNTGPTGAETFRARLGERVAAPGNIGSPTGVDDFTASIAERAERELPDSPATPATEVASGQDIGRVLALALASAGDIATNLRRDAQGRPVARGQALETILGMEEQQRRTGLEERRVRAEESRILLSAFSEQRRMTAEERKAQIDGLKIMPEIAARLATLPPEQQDAQKRTLAATYGFPLETLDFFSKTTLGSNLAQMLGEGLPLFSQTEQQQLNLKMIPYTLKNDATNLQKFLQEQINTQAMVIAGRKAQEFQSLMEEFRKAGVKLKDKQPFEAFAQYLSRTPEQGPALEKFVRGGYALDADSRASLERFDKSLANFGIEPSGLKAEVGKEVEKEKALRPGKIETERAKEEALRPGKIETERAKEEALRPGKISTAKAIKQMEQELMAVEPTGELKNVLLRRPEEGGANDPKNPTPAEISKASEVLLNEQIKKAAATRAIPAEAVTQVATLRGFVAMLDETEKLHQANFTGPLDQYLARAREITGIASTSQEQAFRTIISSFQNQLLQLRSGAAITPQEFERLTKELPTFGLPDQVFLDRLKTTKKLMNGIVRRRIEAFEEFGFGAGRPGGEKSPSEMTNEELKKRLGL